MNDRDQQTSIDDAKLEVYRRVFYASPDYISFSRLDGTYIDVNPGYERFTGLTRAEMIGRTSLEIGIWPSPEVRVAFVGALKVTNELHGFRTSLVNFRQEIRDVEASVNLAEIGGEQVLISIVRDVTERKRDEDELAQHRDQLEQLVAQRTTDLRQANEQLLDTNRKLEQAHNQLLQTEKMASIGQLAAGVAHEINNPVGFVNSNLNSLDAYVRSLLQVIQAYEDHQQVFEQYPQDLQSIEAVKTEVELDYLKEDIFTLLDESKDGMLRVKRIVQDLKDFSHVGAVEWQLADLHAGLDSTLNIVTNEIKYKANVIKEYGALPPIVCLPLELNQVFMNMLVNAAHAIPSFGEIRIRTGVQDDMARIEFSDTGSGISPETIKRIFDPFFTTKPIGQGTGLGLSLAHSIIQKHQGRIEVDSTLGKGSTFRIWLPLQQVPVDKIAA
ncbi:ATP-binding protein [Rhodoferax sp. UBA5149]|uniref:ATP-binding protein n=1 Tax=Rhodoferax sp. UBA5149 TaxID=1947379 RepID=UPI0025CDDCE5|nr:ATP-binding protein [Rhodoferax sp. UBA5149]